MFNSIMTKNKWFWLDRIVPKHEDVLYSFALEELLCKLVGETQIPIIHLWSHPRAFVLGLRDYRLSHAEETVAQLRKEQYSVVVRNSGGAVVPLHQGVLNVSFILPNISSKLEIHDDFERLATFIMQSLREAQLYSEKGEVVGAYCPGDFDLSIDGKKFCGIAQRRQLKARSIQAFINCEGRGYQLANEAKRFYHLATKQNDVVQTYPLVDETKTVSLQEVGAITSLSAYAAQMYEEAMSNWGSPANTNELKLPSEEIVVQMMHSMRKRYEKK